MVKYGEIEGENVKYPQKVKPVDNQPPVLDPVDPFFTVKEVFYQSTLISSSYKQRNAWTEKTEIEKNRLRNRQQPFTYQPKNAKKNENNQKNKIGWRNIFYYQCNRNQPVSVRVFGCEFYPSTESVIRKINRFWRSVGCKESEPQLNMEKKIEF